MNDASKVLSWVYRHPLSEQQVIKATYERLCDAERRLNIIKETERDSGTL